MPLVRQYDAKLNDGRGICVRAYECPVDDEPLCKQIVGHLRWLFHEGDFRMIDALAGRYESTAVNRVYLALFDDQVVATCWSISGRDRPEVGLLAEVATTPNLRGQGLGRRLCGEAVGDFADSGGQWMILGTSNPVARSLYAALGFETYAGDSMIWSRLHNEPARERYWAGGAAIRIRPARWGDLPRLAFLYTTPMPWVISHWGRQVFSSRHFHQPRAVSTVGPTWAATVDSGGAWLVAESESHAIVGSATLTPGGSSLTRHSAAMDLVVHEAHLAVAPQLVSRAIAEAGKYGFRRITAVAEAGSPDKIAALESAGFKVTGVWPGALAMHERFTDVYLFSLDKS